MSAEAPSLLRPSMIEKVLGRRPGRILAIGDRSGIASVWANGGFTPTILLNPGELEGAPGPWDVVLMDGGLENERWDRWLLQRVHRVLEPHGVLGVTTPNLLDVWSPRGAGYVMSRAVRQLRRRLGPRAVIPAADRSAFKGRRYAPGPLFTMVESVGFEIVSQAMAGHGLGPLGPRMGSLGKRTSRNVTLVARRLPSLWSGDRPFPAPEPFLTAFRARHAAPLQARDAWRSRFGPAPAAPTAIPLSDWAGRGAVVLAPHPDDEVIGCGGTLLDLVARDGAVTIVQVTDGSDSAAFIDEPEEIRRQVRLDEARVVADRLGAAELVCLRADNRALRKSPQLSGAIRDVLERTRAGIVFAPSFTDIHPDHQTVVRVLAGALRTMTGPRPDVALYEVWSLVAPTHVHDVSVRIGQVEDLLLSYETALKIDDYVHLVAERLLFNAYEHTGRPGYLECFQVVSSDQLLEFASGIDPRETA
jgi:N-acetylglucosamine malate deacetylase 1